MTYLVDTQVINPFGICLGEDLPTEHYKPRVSVSRSTYLPQWGFRSYPGEVGSSGAGINTYTWIITFEDIVIDYVRRVYNLSDDTEIEVRFDTTSWTHNGNLNRLFQGALETFETEAEALAYVDNLGNPDPMDTVRNNRRLFTAQWQQEIDGIWLSRSADLRYTGDTVSLYTINDLVNFLALFFEVTLEEVWDRVVYYQSSSAPQDTSEPSLDCTSYIKATIIDVDGPGETVEIDIDFTGSSIGDVTVTVIDGDPDSTKLENGVGSITISDAGNISMLNDGGTFFLNEFGNVGFYANNDASLTANTQVQLGVGGTSVTVENDCFTFRDGTGNVELIAHEPQRNYIL